MKWVADKAGDVFALDEGGKRRWRVSSLGGGVWCLCRRVDWTGLPRDWEEVDLTESVEAAKKLVH